MCALSLMLMPLSAYMLFNLYSPRGFLLNHRSATGQTNYYTSHYMQMPNKSMTFIYSPEVYYMQSNESLTQYSDKIKQKIKSDPEALQGKHHPTVWFWYLNLVNMLKNFFTRQFISNFYSAPARLRAPPRRRTGPLRRLLRALRRPLRRRRGLRTSLSPAFPSLLAFGARHSDCRATLSRRLKMKKPSRPKVFAKRRPIPRSGSTAACSTCQKLQTWLSCLEQQPKWIVWFRRLKS